MARVIVFVGLAIAFNAGCKTVAMMYASREAALAYEKTHAVPAVKP
jgi:hypothetical protein